MDFFVDHAVLFALVCAGVAILYGLYLTWWLLEQPAGNERMREISRAVQEGAGAYLRKQYTTIAAVAVVPFLLIGFYNDLGWGTAIGFLFGATLSAAAGFIGMNVAVRSNVRTAEAAREGVAPAFRVAFRAGSVTGLLVVGLGLLGVAGYYWILTGWIGNSPESAVDDLIGSHSAARSSPCSRVSAAGSTRRPPTSAPTSSGRSRRASPRTTRATPR